MDRSQRREFTQSMNRSTGSYELVGSAVLLALIGFAVDRWLGTTPIVTIMAAVIGFAGAAVKIYYTYALEMDRHDAEGPWGKPARSRDTTDPTSGGSDD